MLRLRDEQAATRSDYTDLTQCSSGNGYVSRATGQRYGTNTTSKMQVFNNTPPSQAVLPSAHKEGPNGMAAQPFQATIDPSGDIRLVQSRAWWLRESKGIMSKIIETPFTQMTEIGKEDAPLMPTNESMIPGGLLVQTGGTAIPVTTTSMVNKIIHRSYSSRPAAEDENWDEELDRGQTPLKEVHHTYQEYQSSSD